MPCMDGGPSRAQIEREARDAGTVYRLACERCKDIESNGGEVPDWARDWWEFHKVEDMKRERREVDAKKREEDRQAARDKLSPYDRAILGL